MLRSHYCLSNFVKFIGKSNGLSPDLFLSPRTPKQLAHSEKNTKKLGTTPRSTPRLSPMNFASDFGKINKKEGNMNALDATSGKSFVVIKLP